MGFPHLPRWVLPKPRQPSYAKSCRARRRRWCGARRKWRRRREERRNWRRRWKWSTLDFTGPYLYLLISWQEPWVDFTGPSTPILGGQEPWDRDLCFDPCWLKSEVAIRIFRIWFWVLTLDIFVSLLNTFFFPCLGDVEWCRVFENGQDFQVDLQFLPRFAALQRELHARKERTYL